MATAKQKALFEVLQKRHGKRISTDSILEATGWKESTWRVYVNNGNYRNFLAEDAQGDRKN